MVDFRDIAPSKAQLELGSVPGKKFDVPGINVEGLALLLISNPEAAAIFEGAGGDFSNPAGLVTLGAKFLSEFIAAGLGYPGDEKAIEVAKALPPGDALKAVEAIAEVSFPDGLADFLGKIRAAGDALSAAATGSITTPAAKKPSVKKPNKKKTASKKSASAKQ